MEAASRRLQHHTLLMQPGYVPKVAVFQAIGPQGKSYQRCLPKNQLKSGPNKFRLPDLVKATHYIIGNLIVLVEAASRRLDFKQSRDGRHPLSPNPFPAGGEGGS